MPARSPRLLSIAIKEARPKTAHKPHKHHKHHKSHDQRMRMRVKPKIRKSTTSHRTSSHRSTKRPTHATKHAATSKTTRKSSHTSRRTSAWPARNSAVIGIARASAEAPEATDGGQTSDDAASTSTDELGVAASQAADSDNALSTPTAGPSRLSPSPQQPPQAIATSTAASAGDAFSNSAQASVPVALSSSFLSATQSVSSFTQSSSLASNAPPVIGIAASVGQFVKPLTARRAPSAGPRASTIVLAVIGSVLGAAALGVFLLFLSKRRQRRREAKSFVALQPDGDLLGQPPPMGQWANRPASFLSVVRTHLGVEDSNSPMMPTTSVPLYRGDDPFRDGYGEGARKLAAGLAKSPGERRPQTPDSFVDQHVRFHNVETSSRESDDRRDQSGFSLAGSSLDDVSQARRYRPSLSRNFPGEWLRPTRLTQADVPSDPLDHDD